MSAFRERLGCSRWCGFDGSNCHSIDSLDVVIVAFRSRCARLASRSESGVAKFDHCALFVSDTFAAEHRIMHCFIRAVGHKDTSAEFRFHGVQHVD